MKREKNPAVESLKWFLDFLNANLDDAPEEEIHRRLFEVCYRFEWTPEGAEPVNVPAPEEVRQRYTVRQGRQTLKMIQAGLREFLDVATAQKTVVMGTYSLSLIRNSLTGKWQLGTRLPKASVKASSKVKSVWLPAATATLALTLHDLPSGLPRDLIQPCAECEKLFLRLSEKPKAYCTSRCTSVSLSRKRRGEPESPERKRYNRKMQKIMKQRYREKSLGESGQE